MMIGAEPEIGVSLIPAKPAQPMPTVEESIMTSRVAKVAEAERRITSVRRSITPNITGTSVPRSDTPVSANALLSMETPVSAMSICGYAASISSRNSRAYATASGTSVRLCSGYCNTTLTAVALPSGVMS